MDPKKFAELEQKVLEAIPAHGGSPLATVMRTFSIDESGYGMSDAKAALLGLKASGKVQLDDDGTVRRK